MPTPRQTKPDRSKLLGTFLRTHRERIALSPDQQSTKRRRTPGLRREEVAQTCGVSTTWYTWLEQGRPVSASADTLSRIASALQLTLAERMYLFEITGASDPVEEDHPSASLPESLKTFIHAVPAPAYLLDRQ